MKSVFERKSRNRCLMGIFLLGVLTFGFFVLNLCVGSVNIPLRQVAEVLSGGGRSLDMAVARNVVMEIRLPRALAALILGGALALSGYLLQTFFHNPIAGPFVLGISSGAKLAVALVMIAMLRISAAIGSVTLIAAAFSGALLSMGFVLLLARKLEQMSLLVVGGVMIGYICSAITDFVVTFADDSNIVNLHNWSRGSFSGINWDNVHVMAILVLTVTLMTFLLSKPLQAYRLGESYAGNLGVNIKHFRILLVVLSSILSACVTAFAGPVSFVGIAVPHLVKALLQTARPVWMIPSCFLGGAFFCLACDLAARVVFSPTELSISTVTAVFGAPIVLLVMVRRRKGEY